MGGVEFRNLYSCQDEQIEEDEKGGICTTRGNFKGRYQLGDLGLDGSA
jgi:hypothetical protein